jgi:predicted AAA+ superfamily ATPase
MDKTYLRQVLKDELEDFKKDRPFIARIVDVNVHIKTTDITIITGVRRCGKSTFLRQIRNLLPSYHVLYIDLESPRLATFELSDFEFCDQIWQEQISDSQSKDVVLFVDEVQNVIGWERWIRYFSEKRKFKVFITGSNSEMLSTELGSSLGGRYVTLELFPFSVNEIASSLIGDLKTVQQTTDLYAKISNIVDQGLQYGMFPKPFLEKSTQIYPYLFNDIISRDIVKRKKIRKPLPLLELGNLLARDNTRTLNNITTAELIGLEDPRTIAKYISYFKEAYLFFTLRSFSSSLRKQIRGRSKNYCIDPILADQVSSKQNRFTAALENFIFLELLKQKFNFGFWLSSNGYEVDFVLENKKNELTAIQVCYDLSSQDTIKREVRALLAAKTELKADNLIIVTRDQANQKLASLIPDNIKVQSIVEYLGLWGEQL